MLISIARAWLSLAPWVPARQKDLSRITSLAKLKKGEVFIDLGCGDGRVADYMALHTPAHSIGVELAWPLYLICKIKELIRRRPNLKFYCRNLYQVDLQKADVVFLFAAGPKFLTTKLKNKLNRELKSGARVISYAFAFSGLRPSIVDKPSKKDLSIFLYKIL